MAEDCVRERFPGPAVTAPLLARVFQLIYVVVIPEGHAMKFHLATAFAAILLAACSPSTEPADDAAANPEANADAGAAHKRLPLPDCSEVQTQDAGADGWLHPDCRLMLSDGSNLAIEARYTPSADNSTIAAIQIVAPGDATLQTLEETMGNTIATVKLEDVDRDGRQDIWVPLETGNVNTSWAIWRQTAGQEFVRVGEISGVETRYTGDGLLAVPARSGAASWSVTFYEAGGTTLIEKATVDVTAEGGPDGVITSKTCMLAPGAPLLSEKEPAAAEAAFCAEPVVTGVFE